ncbi:MAG: phage tail tape measure protein [Candidatus Pristimantibacillus sp.]
MRVISKGREYEVAFKIGAELEASFKKTLGLTEQNLAEINREVKKITSNSGFNDMENDLRDVNRRFGELEGSARDFGGVMKNVAEHVGAFAILDKGAEVFTGMIGAVGDYGTSMSQIQAATGLTAKEMEAISESTKGLYTKGLGESYNDLADAMVTVRQVTQTSGEELENLTQKAIVYKDVFGEDVSSSIKAVDTMMRNFGINSDEAFNLLAQGAQKGLDKSGELLDTANEYSPYFAKLGFSAESMFDTFSAGLEAGAFNLDKVGDGIKEFGIRTKDGSKSSLEAYKAIGLNGAKMTEQFAQGGEVAQIAFMETTKAISELEDPVIKNAAAVQLFGTQAEDLEDRVINAYANIESQFDRTANTMADIEAVKYDNLQTDFKQLTRELMDEFILPLAEDIMPEIREFVDFLSNNKGLIKNLALIIPGAMAAKGAANGIKSMTTMSKAAMTAATGVGGAGKAMGALRIASGLLGGPVGLAVTGIGALTFGVAEYKRHQEEARSELLNMGEAVAEAYGNYKEVQAHTTQVNNLIAEYDELNATISNSSTPSEELEVARARLLEVEQQLIDLNPDILNAEDAKSGKFREQLGLVEKLNETQNEMAKRELEKNFIDNQVKLASLEDEYNQLVTNATKYDEIYNSARDSYVMYQEFMNQRDAISSDSTLDYSEQMQQLDELLAKVNEITGMGYNHFAAVGVDTQGFKDAYDTNYDKFKSTQSDMEAANNSFQAIYDTSKAYIEMNLGGTIEDLAGSFDTMSEAEKTAFTEALRKIAELNDELDLLPTEKKINVQVIYDEANGLTSIPGKVPQGPPSPKLDQYADGGFANRASIFGEAGLEAAIPIDNRQRSHAILDDVNRMMGHDSGSNGNGTVIHATFSPVVTIAGGTPNVATQVTSALNDEYVKFEAMLNRYNRQQGRLGFK